MIRRSVCGSKPVKPHTHLSLSPNLPTSNDFPDCANRKTRLNARISSIQVQSVHICSVRIAFSPLSPIDHWRLPPNPSIANRSNPASKAPPPSAPPTGHHLERHRQCSVCQIGFAKVTLRATLQAAHSVGLAERKKKLQKQLFQREPLRCESIIRIQSFVKHTHQVQTLAVFRLFSVICFF